MDIGFFGMVAVLGLAGCGSALGIGTAGMGAAGAWKKCYAQNKPAPFMLVAFTGAPLTQTIYGFILMNMMQTSAADPMTRLGAGLFGGLALMFSAWYQGKVGAAASDALAETGKGTSNYLLAIGLVETVALFVMVFLMINL